MTVRSEMLQLPAVVRNIVVGLFLSTIMTGPANADALPPCDGGGRIVNLSGLKVLSNCSISGNSNLGGPGGGVENHGTMVLTNVTISGNSTDGDGGGIYNGPAAVLTLTNVSVTSNTAGGFGGGIANDRGTVQASNVTVTGNTAGFGGGGIANLSGSVIGAGFAVANNTTTAGDGGGILNFEGTFCVTSGIDFTACFASPGGGNSLVTGNHADGGNGGGFADEGGSSVLSDSTLDGNTAGGGGGLFTEFSTTTLLNITLSNNTATGNGGGLLNSLSAVCCGFGSYATNITIAGNRAGGNGGGVYTTDSGATLLNSATIAGNTAAGSGGGLSNDDSTGALTELLNTLLARNDTNCSGRVVSDGYNLDTGTTCAFTSTGDQSNVGNANVGLGTLASNGGPNQGNSQFSAPMQTLALSPASPAVDAGVPGNRCPKTDERGVPRPQLVKAPFLVAGPTCDIGAYELLPITTFTPQGIPTLSPWVTLLLLLLLALVGTQRIRRRALD